MNIFEWIGIITTVILVTHMMTRIYRFIFPKKYNWDNCPRDHDTMSRYGAKECPTCNSKLN